MILHEPRPMQCQYKYMYCICRSQEMNVIKIYTTLAQLFVVDAERKKKKQKMGWKKGKFMR